MPGIGFMNYRRMPVGTKGRTFSTGRRLRVRFNKATGAGKVVSSYYKPRARAAIASTVKSILNRQEETKCLGLTVENAVQHNAAISSSDLVPILAGMSQGTGSSDRTGDKVRPSALRVEGAISYNDVPGAILPVPLTVKIFCLQWKGLRDGASGFGSVPISRLMDFGGGTNSWDGSTLRSLWRINSDDFSVLASRTVKLSDATDENSKCLTARYSMSIPVPAVFNYAPGAIYPSNFAPFFAVGYCRDDGVTPGFTDLYVVNTAQSFLYYKDA